MNKKNDKKKSNSYGELVFIFVGGVIGYFCFAVNNYYAQWFALPFFIFDVAFILVSFYIIRNRYRNITRGFLQDIASNVSKISNGEDMDAPKDNIFSPEVSELYDSIEALHKSLVSQSASKDKVIGIINSIVLNIELEKLLDEMLPQIIEATGSNWGAFYLYNAQSEKMELKSSVGFTKNIYKEFDVALGDGFVGQGALDEKIDVFTDIPDDTIYISKTFLGKIKPRSVMTVPIRSEDKNVALLLLASINNYKEEQLENADLIRYYMGSAVTNSLTFERTKRLKNELLFQNQLIQNMNEELENKVDVRTRFLNDVLNSIVEYAIISTDAYGTILTWNKGAEAMRGFKEEEVIGKHITETYLEEIDELMECFEIAKREGKYDDYRQITRVNGEKVYIHRIITTVRDDEGDITGFTTISRNMTSNKRLADRAAYLSLLCDLLIVGGHHGMIVMDAGGSILNINSIAAEMCCLELDRVSGGMFENLFVSNEVFRRNLKICVEGTTGKSWRDKLNCGGETFEMNISLTGMIVPSSSERIAVAHISKYDS